MRVLMSGTWRTVDEITRILNHPGHSPQKVHGGSGGAGDDDFDDGTGGFDESELDDPDGLNEGLPAAYTEKYGQVLQEYGIGTTDHAVITTDKKKLHVARDPNGSREGREVVQELTGKQARELGDDVWDVTGGGEGRSSAAGVRVDPAPGGVEITWGSGSKTAFTGGDNAAELAETLGLAADDV